ncbi:hypothetical protein SH2C18_09830 [Clostridium sediminicola]
MSKRKKSDINRQEVNMGTKRTDNSEKQCKQSDIKSKRNDK